MTHPQGQRPELPDPAELVNARAPLDTQLAGYLAAHDLASLGEFAELLAQRRDQLTDRARELATREQAVAALVAPPPPPSEGSNLSVHPAAVAGCLAGLIAETGDDVNTVSIALGVPPAWMRGVLTGQIARIDPDHLQAICAALESSRGDLFGVDVAGTTTLAAVPRLSPFHLAPPPPTTPPQEFIDRAGFLPAQELADALEALRPAERAGVVDALANRHVQLETWEEDLDIREERVAARLQVPSPDLPAGGAQGHPQLSGAAAAAQLEILAIDTGESLDALAQGLGLDPVWVQEVVDGRHQTIDAHHARQLCDALELNPSSVFGPAGMALEGPTRFWATTLNSPAHHEFHLELVQPPGAAPDLDLGP